MHGTNYQCPLPELIDGEEEYKVEKVIASRRFGCGRKLQYLVKWKGYPDSDNQWISKDDVFVDNVIREFKTSNPNQEVHIRQVVNSPSCYLLPHLCHSRTTHPSTWQKTFGLLKSFLISATTSLLVNPIATCSSVSSTTSPRCMDENTPASVTTLAILGTDNWTPCNAPPSPKTSGSEQPPPSPTRSHYSFVVEEIGGPAGVGHELHSPVPEGGTNRAESPQSVSSDRRLV